MSGELSIFNPFIHPDLVFYPVGGQGLASGHLLPAMGHEIRLGAGAYTARMASHLGMKIALLDWVGDDLFGTFTADQLDKYGWLGDKVVRYHGGHMACMSVADTESTGATMVASYPERWRRNLQDYSKMADLVPLDSDLYVYSWLWSFAHPALADQPTAQLVQNAVNRSQTVLLDPNWKPSGPPPAHELDQLKIVLELIDVLLPNQRDAAMLVGQRPPADTVRALLDLGPRAVALTCGSQGVFVADHSGAEVLHVPPYPAELKDTTGAGDYFGGAFAAAEGSLPERAALANVAAVFGCQIPFDQGLPPVEQLQQMAAELVARTEVIL